MTTEVQAHAQFGLADTPIKTVMTIELQLDADEFLDGLANAARCARQANEAWVGCDMAADDPPGRGMLIGLAGKKRAGKDTAADVLALQGFSVRRFADPLKAMLRTLFEHQGYSDCTIDAMLEGALKEKPIPSLADKTPRHAMQTLGTEWGRGCIDGDLWVRTLIEDVGPDARVVVPDVRFANELAAIKGAGGVVIWIDRPGLAGGDGHASENAIAAGDCDLVLTNDTHTARAFQDKAARLFDLLLTLGAGHGRDR